MVLLPGLRRRLQYSGAQPRLPYVRLSRHPIEHTQFTIKTEGNNKVTTSTKTTREDLFHLYGMARRRGIPSYLMSGKLYVWCGDGYEDIHTEDDLNRKCRKETNDNENKPV